MNPTSAPDRRPQGHARRAPGSRCRTGVNASGFTLIELMVTVALVAVLVTLAAPSFSALWQRQQARITTMALASDVARARTEALQRARSVSLCATADGQTCIVCTGDDAVCAITRAWAGGWMLFLDDNANGQLDHSGRDTLLKRQLAMAARVQITDRNGLSAGDALVYRPLGWAVGESRSFVVSHPDATSGWCVVISSNGRASVRPAEWTHPQWTCLT